MGASGWAYFVPYQSDIEQALQGLRQKVFGIGEFYKPAEWFRRLYESNIIDEQRLNQLLESVASIQEPKTIEALIQLRADQGTHSIIDITRVSTQADFGVMSPLTPQEYTEIFGTDQPTRELVEREEARLQEMRDGWQGVFVVVYKDGSPDEIFFTGYSGD